MKPLPARLRGPYADVPFDGIVRTFAAAYPNLGAGRDADPMAFRKELGRR